MTSVLRRSIVLPVAAAVGAAVIAVATTLAVTHLAADGQSESTATRPDLEARNTAVVRTALDEVRGHADVGRIPDLYAEGYVEHAQNVGAGRAGVSADVTERAAERPRRITTIKRILADGRYVAVHSQLSATPDDAATGESVLELFALDGGRIVEHWSFAQAVPPSTASGNTMFDDVYSYGPTRPVLTSAQEEANKQLVLKATAALFMSRDFTVLDRYWAPGEGYLQHNPRVPNGVDGLRGFVGSLPPSVSQNRFALADGDLVLTINQSLPTAADLGSDHSGSAVVDVYRVVDGRFVEHWDVIQPVPPTTRNGSSILGIEYPPGDAEE